MSTILVEGNVTRAQVFSPKEEGWSETVNITLPEEFDGFTFNDEGIKEATKVSSVSVFISAVIKALAESNSSVGAFLSSKTKEQKVMLVPVLLAGAKIKLNRELNDDAQEYITTIENITLTKENMDRVNRALDSLFGF